MSLPLLSVHISASYAGHPEVLRDLALEVRQGEILGLIGQSGCGKSTLALAIPRLLHVKNGTLRGEMSLAGRDLMKLNESQMRSIRGESIALVLQSPISSLNPALRIGTQLDEAWRAHKAGISDERGRAILQALESVSLDRPQELLHKYPSQLSVGQAQRVLIAMSILHRPALIVADEPTSALDAVTQSEILQLFSRLNRELGTSILYISHDLLSVSTISHRVAVMAGGRIVQCSRTDELFSNPIHPAAIELIRSVSLLGGFASRRWADVSVGSGSQLEPNLGSS